MSALRVFPPVADALAWSRPIVALESSVLAQGLPIPTNREAAERMTSAVRRAGAVPAITAVVAGQCALGLADAELLTGLRAGESVLARELARVAMTQLGRGHAAGMASLSRVHDTFLSGWG